MRLVGIGGAAVAALLLAACGSGAVTEDVAIPASAPNTLTVVNKTPNKLAVCVYHASSIPGQISFGYSTGELAPGVLKRLDLPSANSFAAGQGPLEVGAVFQPLVSTPVFGPAATLTGSPGAWEFVERADGSAYTIGVAEDVASSDVGSVAILRDGVPVTGANANAGSVVRLDPAPGLRVTIEAGAACAPGEVLDSARYAATSASVRFTEPNALVSFEPDGSFSIVESQ